MKGAFRSAFIITLFTLAGQLVLFVSQIISAAIFGAGSDMDAFLAANTLPQYIITVLLGSLGFVFIPVFIDYKVKGKEDQAYGLAVRLFNTCILVLGIITILGIIFAEPLLQLTAPGLSPHSKEIAVRVAIITWPTILATGAFGLLSSIYQAEKRFNWQAGVPLIGAVVNLTLLLLLARWLGVIGLAIAASSSIIIQVFLLLKILIVPGRYKFALNWKDPGLVQVFRLALPLITVAFLTKFTPIIDRFLASGLKEGSISHLNYAFKIASVAAALISMGGATVIFPKMSLDVSNNDLNELRRTMSFGLRIMWLIIAPIVTIGFSLALPMIIVLLKHGEFTYDDSVIVSDILKIYLIALISMCLGSITGKGFYALKDTKTIAVFGIIESFAYAIYTIYLAQWLGVIGIAIGYAIYFNVSLIWQLLILNNRTGKKGDYLIVKSFSKTIFAALAGGAFSYLITVFISMPMIQLIAGGIIGLVVYLTALLLIGSEELKIIRDMVSSKKI